MGFEFVAELKKARVKETVMNSAYGFFWSMVCSVAETRKENMETLTCCDIPIAGKEAPESLFVKEMKRRGMKTSSLPSGSEEEDSGISKTNLVSTEIENSLSNQRERSMALNSEGIEVNSFRF